MYSHKVLIDVLFFYALVIGILGLARGSMQLDESGNADQMISSIAEEVSQDFDGSLLTKSKRRKSFIYGNYSSYYNYRNKETGKESLDPRLILISKHLEKLPEFQEAKPLECLLAGKRCLDIGCNTGEVTIEVAKHFSPSWILGVDIDKRLIEQARKRLLDQCTMEGNEQPCTKFPKNVRFSCENWVDLPPDSPIVSEYDVILW